MTAERFTFFEKFGEVLKQLNDEDRKELSYALVMYGTLGEEVELPYLLGAVFTALKEDIDHSKQSQKSGSKGGRPTKKPPVSETAKPPVSEDEKPPVSETQNPPFSDDENQGFPTERQKTESQYNTSTSTSTSTKQCIERNKRKRFSPPTPAEVEEYAKNKDLTLDAQRFCDFYASKGWKVGSSPMKDWRAAARNWAARDNKPHAIKGGRVDDDLGIYATL